jgi:hypothetical protein
VIVYLHDAVYFVFLMEGARKEHKEIRCSTVVVESGQTNGDNLKNVWRGISRLLWDPKDHYYGNMSQPIPTRCVTFLNMLVSYGEEL